VNEDTQLWSAEKGARAQVRRAIVAAAAQTSNRGGELAILLTGDSRIRVLNRDWRGQDKATNVLSFPAKPAGAGDTASRHLGDIAIAYETCAREAREQGKSLTQHLAHLAVHGYLHLMGHDHQTDGEAQVMEDLERAILARLKMRDPYAPAARGEGP
jgi:probable rRNA maturation factor